MKFICRINIKDGPDEIWGGKIISYNLNKDNLEMYIESRSSLHIIIGKNMLGNYACIPNFEIGCYLSDLGDIFWNTEKLCSLIGESDGITAATAIKYVNEELLLWDYF